MSDKEEDDYTRAECGCNGSEETHHSVLGEMPHKEERGEGKENQIECPARIFNGEQRSEEIPDLSKHESNDIEPGERSPHCISRKTEEDMRIPQAKTITVFFYIGDKTLAGENIARLESLSAEEHRIQEDEEKNYNY